MTKKNNSTVSIKELVDLDANNTIMHCAESHQEDIIATYACRKHKAYVKLIGKDLADKYLIAFFKEIQVDPDVLNDFLEPDADEDPKVQKAAKYILSITTKGEIK